MEQIETARGTIIKCYRGVLRAAAGSSAALVFARDFLIWRSPATLEERKEVKHDGAVRDQLVKGGRARSRASVKTMVTFSQEEGDAVGSFSIPNIRHLRVIDLVGATPASAAPRQRLTCHNPP